MSPLLHERAVFHDKMVTAAGLRIDIREAHKLIASSCRTLMHLEDILSEIRILKALAIGIALSSATDL